MYDDIYYSYKKEKRKNIDGGNIMAKVKVLVRYIEYNSQVIEVDTDKMSKHITKQVPDNEDIIDYAIDNCDDIDFNFSGDEYDGEVIEYID